MVRGENIKEQGGVNLMEVFIDRTFTSAKK